MEVRISTCSWLLGGAILSGALLLTGCAGGGSTGGAGASPKPITAAQACGERPNASGNIYVWTSAPGMLPQVQVLDGKWGWDSTSNKCVTSVQFVIAHAPQTAGTCTQVGYVADNPGYHEHGISAPRLKHVFAEAGPAC